MRARLRAHVRASLPEAVHVPLAQMPPRLLAAACLAYPDVVLARVRRRFDLWTALPGDVFDDFLRDLRLEVVSVRRPGRPELAVVARYGGRPIPGLERLRFAPPLSNSYLERVRS